MRHGGVPAGGIEVAASQKAYGQKMGHDDSVEHHRAQAEKHEKAAGGSDEQPRDEHGRFTSK